MSRKFIVLVGALFSAFVGSAAEGRTAPEFSMEVTAASRYLWRGTVVNNSPSLQPSFTVGYRGLSVNLWSNLSRSPLHNQAWSESDITVEYGRQFGKCLLTAGYTDYEFVDTPAEDGNRSSEVYLGWSWAGPLSPAVRVYRDIGIGDGYYYSASIAKGFRLPRRLNGVTTLGIGLNQHQFQKQTTISNVESTTSVELYSSERVVVAPFFTLMAGHRSLFGTHAMFGLRATWQR